MNSTTEQPEEKRNPFWFIVCIAILAAGIASFVLLRALKPAPEQRDPAELIPVVQTSPLQYRQSPLIIEGNGIVVPKASITVSSQVNGEVVSLHPNLVSGGFFARGETLIQIDPRTYQANLDEALANQSANQSNLSFIITQLSRLQSLLEDGFTGEETLDDAISRRDQAQAAVARQEAIIEIRRLDLERTSIRSPFAGIIYSENIDIGDIVTPGRELARFFASDEVEIIVSLNVDDSIFIPNLWQQNESDNVPRRAWVTVNHGDRLYQWQGYVHRVEADIDRSTRTVDVVVRIRNPFTPGQLIEESNSTVNVEAPPLLVGMYSNVAIEGMELDRHFVLPVSALHQNNTIWTATTEGVLQEVEVEFVRQEGNQAVLLAPNLPEGTPIIISDIALMSNGMRVQIGNPKPGAIN